MSHQEKGGKTEKKLVTDFLFAFKNSCVPSLPDDPHTTDGSAFQVFGFSFPSTFMCQLCSSSLVVLGIAQASFNVIVNYILSCTHEYRFPMDTLILKYLYSIASTY